MCGQFYIEDDPDHRAIAEAMNRSPLREQFAQRAAVLTQGTVRPGTVAPVVASNRAGRRAVFPMLWGFHGKTLLINARSETAALKPTFREAWASHRCAIPASGYFEWLRTPDGRKSGDKYALHPSGAAVTWLCGLYRLEEGLPCFVVLTRAPADEIRFIHDRMPLMLPEDRVSEWIRPDADAGALLGEAQTEIQFQLVG